jgi:FtsP/CotA-like multicopper oxidase with cupredoxin domain
MVVAVLALLAVAYGFTSAGNREEVESDAVVASRKPVPPYPFPCARYAPGSLVQNPPDLYSKNGKLVVDLSYQTISSQWGPLFCFMTPDGLENPTFHVQPGDKLIINLTNNTPKSADTLLLDPPHCGASEVTASSVNMHFHGMHISPACHQDDVVRTMVSSGQTFRYKVKFPEDEPPGLYWYHTHVHGLVDNALMGGASGAIVVEGIQNYFPQTAGLQEQTLVIRDQPFPSSTPTPTAGGPTPTPTATPTPVPTCSGEPTPAPTPSPVCSGASNDLSLNFVDIGCPETPAVIQMEGAAPQLWRVVNASGDDIVDLQVVYDGEPQPLQVVAFDGVPVNSQDGEDSGALTPVTATDILLGPGNRAEFVTNPPAPGVDARLITLPVNDGSEGASYPERNLAVIQDVSVCPTPAEPRRGATVPREIGPRAKARFEGLATAPITAIRHLYFSEQFPSTPPLFQFFVTVDGATPTLFYYNNPPAIVTNKGAVEEWIIENRSQESHVFHIHQIHFLVESFNNFPADFPNPNGMAYDQNQYLDSIVVPYWDGVHAYPSVTLKMDFRPPVIGDFVYHCHLAFHEDNGMMAVVKVLPSRTAAIVERARIYLASLGLLGSPDPAEKERAEAWCYRGKPALRKRATPEPLALIGNRAIARRAGAAVSAN